jgi:DNA-binding transcriptional LysR family regulator
MENFRLRVFRVVARHLNFSRAAEELLLTQPAVTQQIKALEDEYGVPLFDRSGGRITLTPAGKCLLPYANKLKEISDEAYEIVTSVAGDHAGKLALGASQTIGQYLLPNLVARFLRDHPRVAVTALSGNTDAILEALADRRIQLAMIEGPGLRKDLHIEPFMEDQMVLVVPASHEWADHEIGIDSLRDAPLLMREFGSGSRRVVESALAKAGLKKKDLRTTMELDSTEGLLSGVEAGLGVTFVSRWAVRNQLSLGTLRLAHVKGLQLSRMFSLAYPAGPEPNGNAGAFRRFILVHSLELVPRVTGKARSKVEQVPSKGVRRDKCTNPA